jgi:hypothetical protein
VATPSFPLISTAALMSTRLLFALLFMDLLKIFLSGRMESSEAGQRGAGGREEDRPIGGASPSVS